VKIRKLGLVAYEPTWRAMQSFNNARDEGTEDQMWLVEHPPVFTLGLAGRPEHVLNPGDIPVVKTDRGGQVTYHGPGQAVVYTMLDLRRMKLGVRELVMYGSIEAIVRNSVVADGVPTMCSVPLQPARSSGKAMASTRRVIRVTTSMARRWSVKRDG